MQKPSVKCALLAAMIAKHKWGTPIDEDNLLAIAAIDTSEYALASKVFDELRSEVYITNKGNRGIELAVDGAVRAVGDCGIDCPHQSSPGTASGGAFQSHRAVPFRGGCSRVRSCRSIAR